MEPAPSSWPEAVQLDDLALERQLCFALAVANRSVLAVYKPLLEPMGLTHPQYLVMLALWEHAPLPAGRLAALLQQEPATLTPLLRRLESAGLLTRTRRADDERILEIDTSGAGRALRQRAREVPAEVARRLGVQRRELEALHAALTRVNAAARTAAASVAPEP